MPALRPAVRPLLVAGLLLSAGCGESLANLVGQTMDACISARNSLFASGQGLTALDAPLPADAEAVAARLVYSRASAMFQAIAKEAGDQVTLVCALDGAARGQTATARAFVARYREHPDEAVAEAARRLSQPPARR
jgi:hypothetical protein